MLHCSVYALLFFSTFSTSLSVSMTQLALLFSGPVGFPGPDGPPGKE